jgi:hypothetical protein
MRASFRNGLWEMERNTKEVPLNRRPGKSKFLITFAPNSFSVEADHGLRRRLVKKWRRLRKLVAPVGGFMILAGVILLGFAVLASSGFLNVGLMFERKYVLTFTILIALIGLFDTFAALVIARW